MPFLFWINAACHVGLLLLCVMNFIQQQHFRRYRLPCTGPVMVCAALGALFGIAALVSDVIVLLLALGQG